MKVILVGYPGSQFLVPASKYLISKYFPGVDVRYINYGGVIRGWSEFVREYLARLDDNLVIFALDDYLIAEPINMKWYEQCLTQFDNPHVSCVKLCENTREEHEGYPVTTQYTVWRRESLIKLLEKTSTPWDFEIGGSKVLVGNSLRCSHPPLKYFTGSALSGRWRGVRLDGLSDEDREYINSNFEINDGQK